MSGNHEVHKANIEASQKRVGELMDAKKKAEWLILDCRLELSTLRSSIADSKRYLNKAKKGPDRLDAAWAENKRLKAIIKELELKGSG